MNEKDILQQNPRCRFIHRPWLLPREQAAAQRIAYLGISSRCVAGAVAWSCAITPQRILAPMCCGRARPGRDTETRSNIAML
jgi:hypothetical protein